MKLNAKLAASPGTTVWWFSGGCRGPELLPAAVLGEGLVDGADGYADACGDGADGFAALAAGEDGGVLVVVDDGASASYPALSARGFEAVLGLGDDIAAPVFGQGQGEVEDEGALGLNIHAVAPLRTTQAQLAPALELAAKTDEIISTLRVTGDDCLIFDIYCSDAARLEAVVDSLARYGPVTTALVLHNYPHKPFTIPSSTTF